MMRNRNRRGSSTLEFSLVGIPMIFVLISTFEMARGMWIYQTLSHGVKDAARYASVHGKSCRINGNSCGITVANVASMVQTAGTGLNSNDLSITFTDSSGSIGPCALSSCLSNSTTWPTDAGGTSGSNLTITATYEFHSALSMFWPGAGKVNFGAVSFPATGRETVQF